MASNINPSNIDGTYPIEGINNDSQGFRTNFSNTANNFTIAKNEIEALQVGIAPKADLGIVSGTVNINYVTAPYQHLQTSGSITLTFSNFPTSAYGVVRLEVDVQNVAHTLTLPAGATNGVDFIDGYAGGVITFSATGVFVFEIYTYNSSVFTVNDITRAKAGGGGGGSAAGPQYAVQIGDPAGTFSGSANFSFDTVQNFFRVGDATDYLEWQSDQLILRTGGDIFFEALQGEVNNWASDVADPTAGDTIEAKYFFLSNDQNEFGVMGYDSNDAFDIINYAYDADLNIFVTDGTSGTSDYGITLNSAAWQVNLDVNGSPDTIMDMASSGSTTVTDASIFVYAPLELQSTADLIFTEKADHSRAPLATFGQLWVRNDTPNTLVFTDDAGTDHDLTGSGSATVTTDGNDNMFGGSGSWNSGSIPGSASSNVFLGQAAGTGTFAGAIGNVVIGAETLVNATTDIDNNVVIGFQAANQMTTSKVNVIIGSRAAEDFDGPDAETELVAVGFLAGGDLTSGENNTLLGAYAGRLLSTGEENTYLGRRAGFNADDDSSRNVIIGHFAGPTTTGDINDQLYIHNAQSDTPLIGGDFSSGIVRLSGAIRFTERSDHIETPAATYGELWVRDDTPNVLVFTDDTGTDTVLGGGGGSSTIEINTQTGTSYTAVLSDAEKMITLDNASTITMTIPANASVAYPVGTQLNFMQLGAGQVQIGITSDTLNVESTLTTNLIGQYAVATALKVTSTSWVLFGNLEAV